MITKTPTTDLMDQRTTLEEWFTTLRDLGVDVDTELAPELGDLRRSARLGRYRGDLNANRAQDKTAQHRTAASVLATTDHDYEDAVRVALDAAADVPEPQLAKSLDILKRASDEAGTRAWTRFKNRGDRALDLIRDAYLRLGAEAVDAWSRIPDGITSRPHAEKYGHTSDWDELETIDRRIENIRQLVFAWLSEGVLNTKGAGSRDGAGRSRLEQYTLDMFLHEDHKAAEIARASGRGPAATGRALTASRPVVRTITEIDDILAGDYSRPTDRDLHDHARTSTYLAERARKELPTPSAHSLRNTRRV